MSEKNDHDSVLNSSFLVDAINNKQLENLLLLSNKKSITVGKKTYKKQKLTSKKWREIVNINKQIEKARGEAERAEKLIDVREKCAKHYFHIPFEVFDEHYEDLVSPLDACVIRYTMGISSDFDVEKAIVQFREHYLNKLQEKDAKESSSG